METPPIGYIFISQIRADASERMQYEFKRWTGKGWQKFIPSADEAGKLITSRMNSSGVIVNPRVAGIERI